MKIKNKYIWLAVILLAAFLLYVLNATRSGLWYDEGIEYFYSRFMTGAVPGGMGTANMLERILATYQPPLYNILMYLWLLIMDTEFWFRLAGIVVTLIGAGGCFLAIHEYTDSRIWSAGGTLAYLLTSGVSYYTLECGEYNLMLCFVAWAFCFYLRVLQRKNTVSLIFFFVFSCLAIYSQYGAAFVIVGMYVSLLIAVIRWKERKLILRFLLLTAIALIAAGLPLLVFFLIPQMSSQGSIAISHMPVFVHNVAVDFIEGIWKVLYVMFGFMGLAGWETRITAGVLALIAVFIAALILTRKKLVYMAVTALITWIIYFFAVCCSFYGYNTWTPEAVGSVNLGDRYCFFLIPMIVITLACGLFTFVQWIRSRSKGAWIAAVVVCLLGLVVYCATDFIRVGWHTWIKDDVREITTLWYDDSGYEKQTLVHQWEEPGFYYYLRKDDRYADLMEDHIEASGLWIRSGVPEQLKRSLEEAGYLEQDDFYYIAPQVVYQDSYQTFLKVMQEEGYTAEELYSGMSALVHLTK